MEENKRDINVAEIFGENVFNDTVMQERLPKKILQGIETYNRGGQGAGYQYGGRHCPRDERMGD